MPGQEPPFNRFLWMSATFGSNLFSILLRQSLSSFEKGLRPVGAGGTIVKFVFRIAAAVMLLTPSGLAQLDRGTITGTVTDASGAVVPNAKIIIKNEATNATYQTATTKAGDYTAANLPAGAYDL